MRLIWKIATPVLCLAVIGGAAIAWQVYKAKTNEQKLAEEARVCRVRAEQGDARAQSDLGNMYYYGRGVPQDYVEAARLYGEAADQGDAKAEEGLAVLYYHGQGVPQNNAESVRWYRKAADQGYAKAEYGIGYMYSHGQCVTQDYGEAARWYRKAADQGDAVAEVGLAALYYHGYGVPQDRAEATRWLRKAADQGSEYAQHSISIRLTTSRLVLLWAQVILCLWLSLGFLLPNSFKPSRGLRDVRQSVISGTGVLGLFSAGLDWYGYTYYKIRCLNCGLNTFTWLHWLLNGVLLILLICIAYILPAKKPEAQEYEIAAEETAEGSSADKELWL